MSARHWVSLFVLLSSQALTAQSVERVAGTTTIGGVEIDYRCIPVPPGARRFYSEASFENADFVRPPNLPDSTPQLPGLTPMISAVSKGSGRGDLIGEFTFLSRWYGYQPGMVILALRDILRTPDGDVYADELSTGLGVAPPPNALMHGAFTFTGGTGRFERATGSAAVFAQQLGDGTHTAFVLCGWIAGL
jgi:hypothetical protein